MSLSRPWIKALFIIWACGALWTHGICPVEATSVEQQYRALSADFRKALGILQHDIQKQALEELIVKLHEHISRDKEGKTLDRAHYLLAQCHHRIHDIDRSTRHLNLALDHYREVVSSFPQSPLADDALYLTGILYFHSDPELSHAKLKSVERLYPLGDMVSRARQRLDELEQRFPELAQGERPPGTGTSPRARMPETVPHLSPRVTDIRHWSGEEYTRVAIYMDSPAEFRERAVPGNPRLNLQPKIHIDLKNTTADVSLKDRIFVQDSFLEEVQLERPEDSSIRITLHAHAIERYRIFSMPDPFRIIVDVRGSMAPASRSTMRRPLPRPSKPTLSDLPAQLGLDVKRIVIDPGHGGKDRGATGTKGSYEKDIVLSIARNLKKQIEKETDIEVILTRSDDRFLTLEERTAIANTQKADLFISLHTNAHPNPNYHGLETYYLNFAGNQEAARVAAMENATSALKISDLEGILQGLMLNTRLNESSRLAQTVHNNLISQLCPTFPEIQDRGVKQAPFYVLLGAEMPSILLEVGFISNKREEKRLKDHRFQEHLAVAISRGIQNYIQQMKYFAGAGGRP